MNLILNMKQQDISGHHFYRGLPINQDEDQE